MAAPLSDDIRFSLGLIYAQAKESESLVYKDTADALLELTDMIGRSTSTSDASILSAEKAVGAVERAWSNAAVVIGRHSSPTGTDVVANAEGFVSVNGADLLAMATAREWDWAWVNKHMRQFGPATAGAARVQAADDLRILELAMEILAVAISADDPSFKNHRDRLTDAFDELAAKAVAYRWCAP